MLITDGASETYVEVFDSYNWYNVTVDKDQTAQLRYVCC